ncbi:MAG: hypothetical protein LBG78_06055, partial [Azoarcus sp.]|nr:hypothetical protein [Azoarcus sp.]
MSKNGLNNRPVAWAWLACLLAAACFLIFKQPWVGRVDTDLLALLPHDERRPVLESALKALSAQGEKQLVLLVSAQDEPATREAAAVVRRAMDGLGLADTSSTVAFPGDFYAAYQDGLLTDADSLWLENATPEAATARAISLAYSMVPQGTLPWQRDPYGFFGNWLKSLSEASPLRPSGGELMVTHGKRSWAALTYSLPRSAFDSDFQQALETRLGIARERIHERFGTEAQFLRAGVVLHAAAATRQAQGEMSLIGLGSLIGTFLLIGLVFQSLRALKLIAVSLVSGTAIAVAAIFLCFGHVHLVTLVFGASLIGVAVDYAILVFAQHLGNEESRQARFKRLLPTLCAALLTPVLAYLALALTPFPGLKQMAVFAVCGIFGAWASVLCFYPWLLPATLPLPKNADFMTKLLARWPRWKTSPLAYALVLLSVAVMAGGFSNLRTNDDIRGLFIGDAALIAENRQISEIIALPSPAQMFLVTASTPELLLQSEERLIRRLRPFIEKGDIGGFEAVSRWLPSLEKQGRARTLQTRLAASRKQLAAELGLPDGWGTETPASTPPLTPEIWLSNEISAAHRALWLDTGAGEGSPRYASMVMLKGLARLDVAEALAKLPAQDPAIPGVEWVDQIREISGMMARYRSLLTITLLIACLIVPVLLAPFFKKRVWRVIAPVV